MAQVATVSLLHYRHYIFEAETPAGMVVGRVGPLPSLRPRSRAGSRAATPSRPRPGGGSPLPEEDSVQVRRLSQEVSFLQSELAAKEETVAATVEKQLWIEKEKAGLDARLAA